MALAQQTHLEKGKQLGNDGSHVRRRRLHRPFPQPRHVEGGCISGRVLLGAWLARPLPDSELPVSPARRGRWVVLVTVAVREQVCKGWHGRRRGGWAVHDCRGGVSTGGSVDGFFLLTMMG